MKLPQRIPSLILGIEGERVRKLWQDFQSILSCIGQQQPSPEMINDLEAQVKSWVTSFLSLATTLEGHQRQNVTPYMHILAMHVPDQMRAVGGIKRFTGQPVEKNNDDARKNYLSSNRLDGAREILLSDARAEVLSSKGCERQVRGYHKHSQEKTIYNKRSWSEE